MPSVTLSVDEDVACRVDTAIAAGLGDHLPIGDYGSADYRSAIRFNAPSWAAWTDITKATLTVYISDHQHVAPKNSSIYVSRMNESGLWTKGAGTQDCESGFSGGNNTQADDIVSTSTNRVSFSSGSTANAKKSLVVTAQVQYYFDNKTSKIVFVFDNNGSDQYTELWSNNSPSNSYDPKLVIEYEDAQPPGIPVLVTPANAEALGGDTPTFSWTHTATQGDPQTEATVTVYAADGTTVVGAPVVVAGATTTLVWPVALPRGLNYYWNVKTADVTGYGAGSGKRIFSIKSLPVVTVNQTRKLVYANNGVRLVVSWSLDAGRTQKTWRVQTTGYDSAVQPGTQNSLTLPNNLNRGVAYPITVTITDTDDLTATGTATFTPQWALTTHVKDLAAVPTNWQTPDIDSTVYGDGSLIFEYGPGADMTSGPTGWYSSLSAVPLTRYLYWRAWFIPSATQSPILRRITIPASFTAASLDDWVNWGGTAVVPPWSVDTGEYVYGSRSAKKVCDGAAIGLRSEAIKLRAGRSYILTGLMRSSGNSGAYIELLTKSGTPLTNSLGALIRTEVLTADRDWFTPGRLDVYRYKTPVYDSPSDQEVYVSLKAPGAVGAQAWFDAVKLEESTVATPWSPGSVGSSIVDAGGVQIDGSKGGVFRYKGIAGQARDFVTGGPHGLFLADTEIASPSTGVLTVNGVPVGGAAPTPTPPTVQRFLSGTGTYTPPAGVLYVIAEVCGGGGAGGGCATTASGNGACGGSGGGGGYARKLLTAAQLAAGVVTYSVGAGGAPGPASATSGGNAGHSTLTGAGFTTVQGNGGTGGGGNGSNSQDRSIGGGSGAAASGGDTNVQGADGNLSALYPANQRVGRGSGGFSAMGAGAGNDTPSVGAGSAGGAAAPANSGGGGTGGYSLSTGTARAGGAGGSGIIVITEYYQ